ncbi:MAG: DMT family transporter, partial [Anaerolineaceae bacterium]|nr:DMT family transporter [Anaerolineaceae bacterium]
MSHLNKGYLIALIATFIWSATAIVIRYLTVRYNLPPLVLAFWRDFFLAVSMGGFFALFARQHFSLPTGSWGFVILYGFVLSIFNSLWTVSVRFNGAAVSTVLAYSSTAFTAILGRIFFKEQLDWVKVMAVTTSILGCVFVSGAHDPSAWHLNTVGIITGIFSGIGFGIYTIMGKSSTQRGINSWTALFYSFAIAAGFIFLYTQTPLSFMEGSEKPSLFWLGEAWLGWVLLFILAVGPTLGGYG